MQGAHGIGENEGGEDVEWRLFRHPQQGRQDDFPRLFLDHFENWGSLNSIVVQKLPKHRCLEDAETDPKSYPNEDDRQCERDPPAPNSELIARPSAEGQY